MSVPTLRSALITQSADQFGELRALLFPWDDPEEPSRATVDVEVADQSTSVTFRCSTRHRRQLVALAGAYGINLSELCRRVMYATIGAYTDALPPVALDQEVK